MVVVINSLFISVICNYMSKILVEQCIAISIYDLKRYGVLRCDNNGIIALGGGGDKVEYQVKLSGERCFELSYTIIYPNVEDGKYVKQILPLLTTICNYGGHRYWFECSAYTDNIYCGRRVGKIYKIPEGQYFACRHCYNLSYNSRIIGDSDVLFKLEQYRSGIKTGYYDGKPTRKHKTYINKCNSTFGNEKNEEDELRRRLDEAIKNY